MKRILSLAVLASFFVTLCASAATQTVTKTYSNKYIDISVKQPVLVPVNTTLPETETEKKIKQTQDTIDTTKKSITDLKKTWGIK